MWFSQKSIFEIIMASEHIIDRKLWIGRSKKVSIWAERIKVGIFFLYLHFECSSITSDCLSNKKLLLHICVHVALDTILCILFALFYFLINCILRLVPVTTTGSLQIQSCLQVAQTIYVTFGFYYFIEIKWNMENYGVCKGSLWDMHWGMFQRFELIWITWVF